MYRPRAHHLVDRIGPHRTTLVGAGAFFSAMLFSTGTAAIGLGEIEVRSYLAEELNLRIGVIAGPEDDLDLSCFSVANGTGDSTSATPQIGRREVTLSLVEVRGSRYLQLRGSRAYNEPLAKLSVRAGCRADASVSRDFIILLDPPPALAPPQLTAPLTTVIARPEAPSTSSGDNASSVAEPPNARSATRAPQRVDNNSAAPGTSASGGSAAKAVKAVRPTKPKKKSAAKPRTGGDRFSLRLSGGEVDLSRSEGISEDARAQIRAKQMLLDADDQIAQLLSLKNTVKQLEGRLNEMQLKLAATTAMPATPPTTAPASIAPPIAAPGANAGFDGADRANNALMNTDSAVVRPPTELPAAATPALKNSISKVASDATPTRNANTRPLGSTAWVFALLLAAIAAGATAWFITRRRRATNLDDAIWTPPPATAPTNITPANIGQTKRTASDAEDAMAAAEALRVAHDRAEAERDAALLIAMRKNRDDRSGRAETAAPTVAAHSAAPPPHFFAPGQAEMPRGTTSELDRFDLDTSPIASMDFPLDGDDQNSLDSSFQNSIENNAESAADVRIRRLRYMHERFPELANQTVSIDDTDSVINAARLYHGESAGDRACELLNFAIEERPQENRFWLAQFEIYRLESRTSEFTALATNFHLLFSHTEAWPKVRHIGHQLDPSNPLFAAAGRAAENGLRFDAATENWLNAPMDFSVDNLVGELRNALFADHGVSASDFDAISARLSAKR